MKRNKGIALVVALLAGALFLTVILAVVSNLSISTRRLTTDQNLTLQAKYAAESGLSLARTQTEAAMYQMSYMVSRINLPKNYPFNTSPGSDLLTHVARFCNVSRSSLPALDTTLANGPGKNDPNVNNLCQFNPGADVTGNNRWSFFTDFIPSDAINDYNNAKDEKTNQLLNTTRQISDPNLKALFNRLFGTGQPQGFKTITTTNGVETGYELQSSLFTPLGVNARQIGGNWVLTFNFIPTPSTSTGMLRDAGDPTKIFASQSLSRSYSNQFKISVTPPSFAQFLQFTDFNTPNGPNSGPADLVWYAPNQLYDGPVHTNDFLAFMANTKDYGAWFGGKVSSAGCVRTTFTADCTPADQKQEVWVRTPTASRLDVTSAIPTYTNPEFADKKDTAGNVIGKDVEWGAKPIDLPTGSLNQESMADQGGILVNASADPPKPTVSGDYNAYPYGNINNMRLWAGKGDNALDGTDFTASDWDPNKNPYKDPDTGETKYAGGWKLNSNYQYIEMVQDVKGYGVCDDPFTGIAITSSKTITASASAPTSQSVVVKITRNPDWQGPIYLDTTTSIPGGGSISGLNTNYDGKGTTSTGASDITVSLPTGWAGPNTTVTIRGTAKMGTGIPPVLGGDDTPQTDTLTLNAAPVADFNPSMSSFSLCPGANSNRTLKFGRSNNTRPISVTSWSITSFPTGGSASMVTVTTSPLPTGVTGSSTTLNVAAISTAVPGAYNLRINLTDGVLNKTINVTVTVSTPSVTGSVSNPAVTLNRPVSIPTSNIDGAFVVTVNQTCGTQPVGVRISSTSSLPAGLVIASSLNVTSAPYQFTARIQSGSNVAAGTYPVTYQIYNTSTNAVLFTGTANIKVQLFGYTLSANSPTVPRNSSDTVTVTANRVNGHNLAINNIVLTSTLPAGVTVGSGLPGSIPGTGSSTSFTLNVSNTAAPGSYTISGKGTDTDGTTQTFSFTLTIPTPTYTLSVNPSSFTFRQGESYTINVTATSQNGFSGNVSISLAGLPSGVTSSPPSGTVSITPTTSRTVTFTLTADIAAGMGTFTGSASSGPRAIGSPGSVVAPFTITIAKSGGQNHRPSPFVTAAFGTGFLTPFLTFQTLTPPLPTIPAPKCAPGRFINNNKSFLAQGSSYVKTTYRIDKNGNASVRVRITLDDSVRGGTAGIINLDTGWQPYRSGFNGVVFIKGGEPNWSTAIDGLGGPGRISGLKDYKGNNIDILDSRSAPPAIARFQQLTIAANRTIGINGDLKYENPPCTTPPVRGANYKVTPATCNDRDTMLADPEFKNILGIYGAGENYPTTTSPLRWGDIRINAGDASTEPSLVDSAGNPYTNNFSGTQAPKNLEVQAVLMSAAGRIYANYDENVQTDATHPAPPGTTSPLGNFRLLGGTIGKFYGSVGGFASGSLVTNQGYGRVNTYDIRTKDSGMSPPGFPTFNTGDPPGIALYDGQISNNPVSKNTDKWDPRKVSTQIGLTRSVKPYP